MNGLESVKDFIAYDEKTGVFSWIKKTGNSCVIGPIRPKVDSRGYQQMFYMNRSYLAHRLAWYFVYGVWPDKEVDNINGNKIDNRISNLRLATRSQNQKNRGARKNIISGLKGVYWMSNRQKYQAAIWLNGKRVSLGCFEDKHEAYEAYKKAAKERDGEFYYEG